MRQFGFRDELAYAMDPSDPFDATEELFHQFPIREGISTVICKALGFICPASQFTPVGNLVKCQKYHRF
jgi:hypothetical protein